MNLDEFRALQVAKARKRSRMQAKNRKSRRPRKSLTVVGRELARDVRCDKCGTTISAGQHGYKRAGHVDDPDWWCEPCVT